MKQKTIHKRQMLLLLAATVVLSWVTFHVIFKVHSVKELGNAFAGTKPRFVLAGILCMALYLLCESESIRTLMKAFETKVPWRRAAGYSAADFYFSAITPSAAGGQPMQLYYMTRDGFGLFQSSFVLLLLAAIYQMMVLIYGLVMIAFNYAFVQQQSRLIKWLLVFGILVNGFCAGGILLIILKRALVERLVFSAVRILTRLRIVKNRTSLELRAEHLIDEYSRGGQWLRKRPAVFGKVILLTLCRLTVLFLVPYFASLALSMTGSGPAGFLAVQAILSLAVTAVPLPGSVGASEGCFLLLYSGMFPAGQTLPLMMLARGISFYGFLAVCGIGTLMMQFWVRKGGAAPASA